MAAGVVWIAGAGAGCRSASESEATGTPVAAASTDLIWALAPRDLEAGLVIADGAGGSLHTALTTLVGALERSPVTAPVAGQMRANLTIAGIDTLDRAKLADAGIDVGRAAAFFMAKEGRVAVLPVANRAKFVAKVGATTRDGVDRLEADVSCKELSGRYVCAENRAVLDRVGQSATASPVANWAAELRGHVELYVSPAGTPSPLASALEGSQGIRIGGRLERGAITVRAHLSGKPREPLSLAQVERPSRLSAGLAGQPLSGLVSLQASRFWQAWKPQRVGRARPMMLPGGVLLGELLGSLDGEIVAYALAGQLPRGQLRIGLASQGPMARVLAACDEIAAQVPTGVTVRKKGERCTVSVQPAVLGLGAPPSAGQDAVSAELWVEKNTLVVDLGDAATPAQAKSELRPFPPQILERGHLLAAWGRGSLFRVPSNVNPATLATIRAEPAAGVILFWMFHLNELGFSVRVADDGVHMALRVGTLWANPDDVVAEAEKVLVDLGAGQPDALARLIALPGRFPGTPLARDDQTGYHGLLLPASAGAFLAGFLLPSFVHPATPSTSISPPPQPPRP